MTIKQLPRKKLNAVKRWYFIEKNPHAPIHDIIYADEIVSDEEIFEAYKDVKFSLRDFI